MCILCLCVSAAFLILLLSFIYLYLPMVLGSEVSWLSSTFKVVNFFNIPAITRMFMLTKIHGPDKCLQSYLSATFARTYTVRQVLQHVGGEQQVL